MAAMSTKSDVIPPLKEWDINLEVSSQVYYLPKDCKPLQKVNLRWDITPLSSRGGL